jgi:hypothetical protein
MGKQIPSITVRKYWIQYSGSGGGNVCTFAAFVLSRSGMTQLKGASHPSVVAKDMTPSTLGDGT